MKYVACNINISRYANKVRYSQPGNKIVRNAKLTTLVWHKNIGISGRETMHEKGSALIYLIFGEQM